jgi:hypothetical protein
MIKYSAITIPSRGRGSTLVKEELQVGAKWNSHEGLYFYV